MLGALAVARVVVANLALFFAGAVTATLDWYRQRVAALTPAAVSRGDIL